MTNRQTDPDCRLYTEVVAVGAIPRLQLLKKNPAWNIPGNIEFEYIGDPMVEIPGRLPYCRSATA